MLKPTRLNHWIKSLFNRRRLTVKIRAVLFFLVFFLVLPGPVAAGLLGSKDTHPPVITMQPPETPQVVFMEKIVIAGVVEAGNRIASLTINHLSLTKPEGSPVFFSHVAELNPGENVLTIKAVDTAGNSAAKTLHITRKPASRIQLSERLSLAILPFKRETTGSNAVPGFQDRLTHALTKRNRFHMIERHQLELILQEQHLNRTSLVSTQTASKIGRLVSARSVLTGTIMNVHKRTVITARMVDVETSKVICKQEVRETWEDGHGGGDMAERLAIMFHQDFPLIDGHIIKKQGKTITVDQGQDKIKPGRRLIIFREEPVIHPVTGKRVGMDIRILGHARVIEVLPETAVARLTDSDEKAVSRLDRFITE